MFYIEYCIFRISILYITSYLLEYILYININIIIAMILIIMNIEHALEWAFHNYGPWAKGGKAHKD